MSKFYSDLIIKLIGLIRNLITVKRFPSEFKGKVMSLLSPRASKKSSIARVENEMIKSLEKFSAGLASPAKRKFKSFLMKNCWKQNENQNENNNDNGDEGFAAVFSHDTRRKLDASIETNCHKLSIKNS